MRVKMRDHTAHADTGSLRADEVYDLSDEVGQHLINQGLAAKSTAKTAQERAEQDEADAAAAEEQPAQPAQSGEQPTVEGTPSFPQRQPINQPAEHATPRSRYESRR